MKKYLLLIVLGVFCYAGVVSAGPLLKKSDSSEASMTDKVAGQAGYETAGVTDTTISESIGGIIRLAMGFTGTIFVILTIYAGILYMTAGGKDETVEKATKIFKTSIIGLIIVVSSYSLTFFVLKYAFKVSEPTSEVGGSSGPTVDKGAAKAFSDGFMGQMKETF